MRKTSPREIRHCPQHGMVEHGWYKNTIGSSGWWRCLACSRETTREKRGNAPMEDNHECPQWLGVHIAERALSGFFDNIERLPVGTSGGDFRCGKGFLIDVKSACLRVQPMHNTPCLHFTIKRNVVADYFLCLGFSDRESLQPIHVWLIPGKEINHLTGLIIGMGKRSLKRWSKYERPLEKVIVCCNQMKSIEEKDVHGKS